MSALAGVFHRDGRPVSPSLLQRLLAPVAHRGPDGARADVAGAVGLAHLSLCTTPEDHHDRQPLHDAASGLRLTFAGRLDNRDELAAALDPAADLRGAADSAYVLRAYERWGQDCPARLLGDFAFAIWDERRREVFCARDVIGIRPFVYHLTDRVFVWASECRQLLAAGVVEPEPNEGMVAEVLADEFRRTDETLFRGVSRLPPAHSMTVGEDRVAVRAYWRLDPEREVRYAHDAEYDEHFRALFEDAVRCRLRTDRGVVAVSLSGGLDSSAVAGVAQSAARAAGGPALAAFSMVFPDRPAYDESRYSAAVARMWDLEAHAVAPSPLDADRIRTDAARHMDVPELASDQLLGQVRERMRARGCRVVLTGLGGDQVLTGSVLHYADLLRRFHLAAAWSQYRSDARVGDAGWTPAALVTAGVLPLLPAWFRAAAAPLARRWGYRRIVPDWVAPGFAARVGLENRLRLQVPDPRPSSFARWDVCRSVASASQLQLTEAAERTTAEYGLEQRHPFFDRRLVEFCVAMPENQRWRGDRTKAVMRRALAPVLPPEVGRRRDKGDFSPQFIGQLDALGGEAFIDRLRVAELGWVDQARISAMFREMRRRHAAHPDVHEAYVDWLMPVWSVAGVELWYRSVFETRQFEAVRTFRSA